MSMRFSGVLIALMLAMATLVSVASPAEPAAAAGPATVTNPVVGSDSPDPGVVRGKDGLYWSVTTGSNGLTGTSKQWIALRSSPDLVTWTHRGYVFSNANKPAWAPSTADFWAPDIQYVNGKYVIYFTVAGGGAGTPAIGVATASSPTGGWTASGSALIPARSWLMPGLSSSVAQAIIDPFFYTGPDGARYLYYGSTPGGLWVQGLNSDGLSTTGTPTKLTPSRFEGAWVHYRNGYYYLFASTGSCCSGSADGYSVFVGRSTSPTGPFVDRDGRQLSSANTGGSLVVAREGKWVAGGHNAIATDAAGRDWMLYHAFDAGNISKGRQMLIDRIDWNSDWPLVNNGRGPSETAVDAPVTSPAITDHFNDPAKTSSLWTLRSGTFAVQATDSGSDAGAHLRATSASSRTCTPLSVTDARIEADVRSTTTTGNPALFLGYQNASNNVRAEWNVSAATLSIIRVSGGVSTPSSTPVPAYVAAGKWRTMTAELKSGQLEVTLGDSGASAAFARVTAPWAAGASPEACLAGSTGAHFDNVTIAQTAADSGPNLQRAPDTGAVESAFSDEFSSAIGTPWTWARTPSTSVSVSGGKLSWTTDTGSINDATPAGAVLSRPAPSGPWIAETKVTFPLGSAYKAGQRAGLILYTNDTNYLSFASTAVFDTKIAEAYQKPTTTAGAVGASNLTAPGDTVYLRIERSFDASGAQRYRPGTSGDGVTWRWGGVFTMPAGSTPRVGLISQGGQAGIAATTAQFDYLRVSRTHDGDVTGDRFADLVTIGGGTLEVRNNAGAAAGYFPVVSHSETGWTGVSKFAVGDYNGDGRGDLVAIRPDGKLYFYPNQTRTATGSPFGAAETSTGATWGSVQNVSLGDIDGDGLDDLVVIQGGYLYVYRNHGRAADGSYFTNAMWQSPSATWGSMKSMCVGDVTGDGVADLLTVASDSKLYLYPNNIFSNDPHVPFVNGTAITGATWGSMADIGCMDVTGDGFAEVVPVDTAAGRIYSYPNAYGSAPSAPYSSADWVSPTGWGGRRVG